MSRFTKGVLVVNAAWMFCCAMKHLFITGDLFWEILFVAVAGASLGRAFDEEDS